MIASNIFYSCALLFIIITVVNSKCDEDWVQHKNKCYRVYPGPCNFFDAITICHELFDGSSLLRIKSADEQKFIESFMGEKNVTFAWIGFFGFSPQTFKFLDGSPIIYSNWYTDEPSFIRHIEFCGVISMDKRHSGTWLNENCVQKGSPIRAICEIEHKQESGVIKANKHHNEMWFNEEVIYEVIKAIFEIGNEKENGAVSLDKDNRGIWINESVVQRFHERICDDHKHENKKAVHSHVAAAICVTIMIVIIFAIVVYIFRKKLWLMKDNFAHIVFTNDSVANSTPDNNNVPTVAAAPKRNFFTDL